jgi:hypothetical protein
MIKKETKLKTVQQLKMKKMKKITEIKELNQEYFQAKEKKTLVLLLVKHLTINNNNKAENMILHVVKTKQKMSMLNIIKKSSH